MKNSIFLMFLIFFISSCGKDEPVIETPIPKDRMDGGKCPRG